MGKLTEQLITYVPALDSLRRYSVNALGKDAVAGVTVATVAIPQAMAYAVIAGVHPQYGLYTAIVMTLVGAFFDPSRLLINGPTNAISIAIFSAVALVPDIDPVQAVVLLAFLVAGLASDHSPQSPGPSQIQRFNPQERQSRLERNHRRTQQHAISAQEL